MANPIVTITMDNGDVMKAELYPEVAPNTVNNFISLVKKGLAPAGRSAQRACSAGKASGCARVLFGVRFRRSDFAVCDADASPSHLLGPFAEKRPQI